MANLTRFGKPTDGSAHAKTGSGSTGARAARSDQGCSEFEPPVSRVGPVSHHRTSCLRRAGPRCHPAVRLSKVHRDARGSWKSCVGRRDHTM